MKNNNHRTKSKRIQCKDVSTLALLEFIKSVNDWNPSRAATWLDIPVDNTVRRVVLSVVPDCVLRKKLDNMARKGLIDGCGCRCRGDFRITPKGLARISLLKETKDKITKDYLAYLYDNQSSDPVSDRSFTRQLIFEIEECLAKGQTTALDGLLKEIDFNRVSVRVAIALTRGTARVKEYLPHWHSALLRFNEALKAKYPLRREGLMIGMTHLLPTEYPVICP